MNKEAFEHWKQVWLKNYVKEYKSSTNEERKLLKKQLYKVNNLTNSQKDRIWELVVASKQ